MTTIKVCDGTECEVVVCVSADRETHFSDNVVAICSECGALVQHRPDVPSHLVPICCKCALPRMTKAAEAGALIIGLTERTLEEIEKYLRERSS